MEIIVTVDRCSVCGRPNLKWPESLAGCLWGEFLCSACSPWVAQAREGYFPLYAPVERAQRQKEGRDG